jgi:hypothetical protein
VGLEQNDDLSSGPSPDELEVTLVGPEWGECVLIHFGGRAWTIIDSCLDNSKPDRLPAALSYLKALQTDIKTEVKLIMCNALARRSYCGTERNRGTVSSSSLLLLSSFSVSGIWRDDSSVSEGADDRSWLRR